MKHNEKCFKLTGKTYTTNHNSKQVIFSVVMTLGRETILLL